MLYGIIGDLKSQTSHHCYETGDKKAAILNAKIKLKDIVKYLGSKDYLIGYLTVLDFKLFELLELLNAIKKDQIEREFPVLVDYRKRIRDTPGVKDYLDSDAARGLKFNNKIAKINV